MSTVTDFVRSDREYEQLLSALLYAKKARTPLPTLVSGLCEGATDAVYASLLSDLKAKDKRAALLICSDEKECVRLRSFFEKAGTQRRIFRRQRFDLL